MEVFWIITLVLVALAALAAVWKPLFGQKVPWGLAARTEIDSLLVEKARALRALKDLEQDRTRGLLGEQEFAEARGEYVDKAAGLNRAIAAITGIDPAAATPPGGAGAEADTGAPPPPDAGARADAGAEADARALDRGSRHPAPGTENFS